MTWYYWNGAAWGSAGAADYNTAIDVNNYIQYFDASNKKLMFKAFLVSDGSQYIELDNIEVAYNTTPVNYYGSQHIF